VADWQSAAAAAAACRLLPALGTHHRGTIPRRPDSSPYYCTYHYSSLPQFSLSALPSSLAEIEKHLIRPGWKWQKQAKFEGGNWAQRLDNSPSFHVGRLLNSTKPLAAFRRGKNHAGDREQAS